MNQTPNRWLHRFACLTASATFLLIIAGASVTSHRAGLSVPDWPTTYGQFMFAFPFSKMVGGIFYEHGHRMIASAVGLLTIVLAIWLARAEPRRWVRRLGIVALAAVIVQGILGGLTVKLFLPPPISIAHASLAEAFLCITLALAMVTSSQWSRPSETIASPIRWFALVTTITVYAQLILGATIRHSEAAVLAHVAGAIVVLMSAGIAGMTILTSVRRKDVVALAVALVLLVLAQLWVGAATWAIRVPKDAAGELTTAQAVLPTLHLLIGAMILATSFALTLKSFRFSATGLPEKKTISAYVELAKPRIVSMVLVTTTIGFFLGGKGFHSPLLLIATLLGTASTAGGAAVLNNYIEREVDAKMERTRRRALPAGVIAPSNALSYGIILVLFGLGLLVWQVNLLTAFLELLATFLYVVVYTPMKRMTWLNTLIGAIPGAIPPMSGWAASAGQLDAGAWVLFLILFIWQHPHFYAIAWMFKDDYRSAGFKMLPVIDPSGRRTFRQTLAYSVLLIGASLLPTAIGMTGKIYLTGALSMGLMMLAIGAAFTVAKSYVAARRLLKASVIYLPVLLVLIIVDVGF